MARQGTTLSSPVLCRPRAHVPAGATPATDEVCDLASAAIARLGMLQPDDHILAAFSGGADSTALAIVLSRLGYRVTLAHIDHGIRADSQLDAFHCRSTARRLNMSIEQARVKVEPPTEANARQLRYEALEKIACGVGANRIATGHTLNDEAETVKMRLARGGFGLGIPPVRGNIVRPLLSVGRRMTEAVCLEAGVLYLDDPSNTDLRITRNRIRRELARAPDGEIERYASIGAQNAARKTAMEARLADFSGWVATGGNFGLDLRAFPAASTAVQRGLVRRLLEAAGIDPSGRLVEDILTKVVPRPGSSLDLPDGLAVWREPPEGGRAGQLPASQAPFIVVGPRTRPGRPVLPAAGIEMPGVTAVAGWGLQVSVSFEPAPPEWNPALWSGSGRSPRNPAEEAFDAARLHPGLKLRQWRRGDYLYPLRHGSPPGRKKLQDLFVDAKVPRDERYSTPLITSGGEIVWVVGHRIDDRYKVTPRTRTVARIRLDRVEGRSLGP